MKKGFILFHTLIVCVNLAYIIFSSNIILQNRLDQLNRTERLNEVYEIESSAIERIKEEFMYMDTKDFTFQMHGSRVKVYYEENTAYISVLGKYTFHAVLDYNQDYARVERYYYPDE